MVIWGWEMRIVPDSHPDPAIATFQSSQPSDRTGQDTGVDSWQNVLVSNIYNNAFDVDKSSYCAQCYRRWGRVSDSCIGGLVGTQNMVPVLSQSAGIELFGCDQSHPP